MEEKIYIHTFFSFSKEYEYNFFSVVFLTAEKSAFFQANMQGRYALRASYERILCLNKLRGIFIFPKYRNHIFVLEIFVCLPQTPEIVGKFGRPKIMNHKKGVVCGAHLILLRERNGSNKVEEKEGRYPVLFFNRLFFLHLLGGGILILRRRRPDGFFS